MCEAKLVFPSLENRKIPIKKQSSILNTIEKQLDMPPELYENMKFEVSKDKKINIGGYNKITPYFFKIKYLLNPKKNQSPYYLVSIGVCVLDNNEIIIDKFLDNITQNLNFGIGVGISNSNSSIELLYGIYNYEFGGIVYPRGLKVYNTTKITLSYKYDF